MVTGTEVDVLHDHIDADEKQDERERAVAAKELALEKRATALAEKERDLQKERADFYETSFKTLTKKPSKIASAVKWGLPIAALIGGVVLTR